MINTILAITTGIITVITVVVLSVRESIKGNIKENLLRKSEPEIISIKQTINDFLDLLEDTREMRYSQYKGNGNRNITHSNFREDWYSYEALYADSLLMD